MCLALLLPVLGAGLAQSALAQSAAPPPLLRASLSQMDAKAPAFLANGVIGLRMPPNPLVGGSGAGMAGGGNALVMGFYKVMGGSIGNQPSPAPAPYPFETALSVNNVSMGQHPELVTVHSATLNTSCGELTTALAFACSNCSAPFAVTIVATAFLSRKIPTLAVMNVSMTFTPSDAEVRIGPNLLPPGSFHKPDPDPVVVDVPSLSQWSKTAGFPPFATATDGSLEALIGLRHASRFAQQQSSLGVAASVLRRSPEPGRLDYHLSAAMLSSRYSSRPIEQSIRIALTGISPVLGRGRDGATQPMASQHTPERLQKENREAWAELWKGRVQLSGPGVTAEDQRVIDLAYFYQHSAVHRSTLDGSACYGLSEWGALGGEIFWDQDAWQQGVTALSDPAAGLSLARFRVRTHDAARKEAAQFGFAGAMYPWQSSGLDGYESLFADAWSGGQTETHITPDVAVGLWESTRLSGDDDFGRSEAWPVIADVARWVMSRGEVTDRGFELRNTQGPDETERGISNDSFMNMVRGRCHNIAAVWVAFFSRWQRYCR